MRGNAVHLTHSLAIAIASAGSLTLALAGCGGGDPPGATKSIATPSTNSSAKGPAASATNAAPLELTPVDRPAYDARIARHLGKVVLVDFWATWCAPCVEQLPHTVKLAERYRDGGLAVMCVSCDEPSELEPIRAVLRSKGAGVVENLVSQFGTSPQTMEAFEIATGALPAYKLYDRKGALRRTFELNPQAERQFTPEDIDAAVEKLLAE